MSHDELVDALVNLAGAMKPLETRLVREAGARVGQPQLAATSAAVLAELRRHRTATLRQLAAGLEVTTTVVRTAMADLERRGLAAENEPGSRPALQTYRTTPAADELNEETRRRAAHHFGYALASMAAEDLAALDRAAPALRSLAAAIGYESEAGRPD
ncbi:MAG: hypothetical protein IT193_03295 [Propionibacteriaceae bacterium]|nr:hypothetical protein [Propionibacteriaceae bacterium]